MASTSATEQFVKWFQDQGGNFDRTAMGVKDFPPAEGGRGAVALKDLPEGYVLFTIPRALTLSTRTSQLPELVGLEQWKQLGLHQGWSGLMLCMMWEASRANESKWAGYLDILPTHFDTPMFWSEDDLSQLTGTSVLEKLGKEDANRDYETKIKPALQKMPHIFTHGEEFYSLGRYHIMGSQILSRSFTVEKWEGNEDDQENSTKRNDSDAMDVDENLAKDEEEDEHSDDDDEEEQDSSDIAMVPMADMLNARYGTENAKLFHEKEELKMITTKPIKSGEQIWNTYGHLPNAELLRCYGHVDVLPLPGGKQGNPGDVVELGADIIVDVVKTVTTNSSLDERIDWWLEEGGDDVLEFERDLEFPPAALSLTRLLLLPNSEWLKAQEKGMPPKPKAEPDLLQVLIKALEKRWAQYLTSIQDDEAILQGELSLNKRHAIIVRLGEKEILQGFLDKINSVIQPGKKRKDRTDDGDRRKKSKR